MIAIVDYGVGNVTAIANVFAAIGVACETVTTAEGLSVADKVILPGVGAFDDTMARLNGSGMRAALDKRVLEDKRPCLGVCVGMQIMTRGSAEGHAEGLGWFADADVVPIQLPDTHGKPGLPHMGWNSVTQTRTHPMLDGLDLETGFYFLHSYRVACASEHTLLESQFGERFACAIVQDNIFGFQFHPEKSHDNGEQLFRNFVAI